MKLHKLWEAMKPTIRIKSADLIIGEFVHANPGRQFDLIEAVGIVNSEWGKSDLGKRMRGRFHGREGMQDMMNFVKKALARLIQSKKIIDLGDDHYKISP